VRRDIDQLRPQLMVLGYCLNDAELRMQRGNDDIFDALARRRPRGSVSSRLYRRSRLLRMIWDRLENSRQRRAFNRYYHALYERRGWEVTQEALDGFRQLSREREVPLVSAVFPIFDQQLDHSYSYRDLHQTVMAAMEERDIPALDLLPAYRGVDATRLALEPFTDPHPGELAHRIASQHLAAFLVDQEVVPITQEQKAKFELFLRPQDGGRERR